MNNDSHYSIIRFVNNSFSDESIAIGLVVISHSKTFIRFSEQKLSFAKKLNPGISNLLSISVKQLLRYISPDLEEQNGKLISFDKQFDLKYLNRLSSYSNGIIQFSQPAFIKVEFTIDLFNEFFFKFISIETEETHKHLQSSLLHNLETKFYNPLKDKIDIDYTLKKQHLPTLFFDYHLDGIGINGAMYAAKAVDFNIKQMTQTKSDISEYESVIERLNIFAKNKGISGNHQYYLIVDPYSGNSPSYMDLYTLLKSSTMPYFKLVSSFDLDDIVKIILQNKARKFSDELELAS